MLLPMPSRRIPFAMSSLSNPARRIGGDIKSWSWILACTGIAISDIFNHEHNEPFANCRLCVAVRLGAACWPWAATTGWWWGTQQCFKFVVFVWQSGWWLPARHELRLPGDGEELSNVLNLSSLYGSPAGGCLLAMSCDYRVMVRNSAMF